MNKQLAPHHGLLLQLIFLPVFVFTSIISVKAAASTPDFYTIDEKASTHPIGNSLARMNAFQSEGNLNPLVAVQAIAVSLDQQLQSAISLITWDHHTTGLEDPTEDYDRLKHFGSWLIEGYSHGGCVDTRAKVLARQSQVKVTLNETGCRVVSGQWRDPYSDRTFTQASELDIDHVVPLKNAFGSGAWKWDRPTRCAYANFQANTYQLLAVNLGANRRKGDSGPDHYMPDNRRFTCDYLNIWLRVKLIWQLALPPQEAAAIAQLIKQNNCNLSLMSMAVDDLRTQRIAIGRQRDICLNNIL